MQRSIILASVLLAAAGSRLPAQDFEGIIGMRVKGGNEMKAFVKGARTRLEFSAPGQGQMTMITDPAAGENLILIPSQSMYMAMKQSDVEKVVADTLKRRAGALTALNRKEQVRAIPVILPLPGRKTPRHLHYTGLGTRRRGPAFSGAPVTRQENRHAGLGQGADAAGAFALKATDAEGVTIWEVVSRSGRASRRPLRASRRLPRMECELRAPAVN